MTVASSPAGVSETATPGGWVCSACAVGNGEECITCRGCLRMRSPAEIRASLPDGAYLPNPPRSLPEVDHTICIALHLARDKRIEELKAEIERLRRPTATAALDPDHCAYCRAFVERQQPPKEKVEVKNECWDSARLKMKQLEAEIHASSATQGQKSNMLHTFSKLCMFATDAWDQEVVRPAQRRERATPTDGSDAYGLPNDIREAKEEIHEWRQAIEALGVMGGPGALRSKAVEMHRHHDEHHEREKKLRTWIDKAWPLIGGHTWPAGHPNTKVRRELIETRPKPEDDT